MQKVLIGEKAGMSQVYNESDEAVPVTLIESPDCVLVMVRQIDGRRSVQLGFDETDGLNKPEEGHFTSRGVAPRRVLREFLVSEDSPLLEMEEGDPVGPDLFEVGERVDVQGRTKGRGFTGAMKRHGFGGGPSSHGGRFGRRTGAVGNAADPSRIFPGKKMPGRSGNEQRTQQNLNVVRVFPDENVLMVSGSIPGPDGGVVIVHSALKGANGRG